MSKYVFTAQRDDYLTPPEIIESVLKKHKKDVFGCDTCCSTNNIPAVFRYKKDGLYGFEDSLKFNEDDGLTGHWSDFNWCNPPFSKCDKFIKKAAEEQKKGNTTVMLIPARVETKYWHDYILKNGKANRPNVEVRFLRKNITFLDPDTKKPIQIERKKKDGSIELVNGVYKNALALVTFKGVTNG